MTLESVVTAFARLQGPSSSESSSRSLFLDMDGVGLWFAGGDADAGGEVLRVGYTKIISSQPHFPQSLPQAAPPPSPIILQYPPRLHLLHSHVLHNEPYGEPLGTLSRGSHRMTYRVEIELDSQCCEASNGSAMLSGSGESEKRDRLGRPSSTSSLRAVVGSLGRNPPRPFGQSQRAEALAPPESRRPRAPSKRVSAGRCWQVCRSSPYPRLCLLWYSGPFCLLRSPILFYPVGPRLFPREQGRINVGKIEYLSAIGHGYWLFAAAVLRFVQPTTPLLLDHVPCLTCVSGRSNAVAVTRHRSQAVRTRPLLAGLGPPSLPPPSRFLLTGACERIFAMSLVRTAGCHMSLKVTAGAEFAVA
ncbi:hypothetical protein MKZ38_005454 [Zalerion maritima]|uniref:Uncharacterized protein n=1 Tax=Zalerion maritima TaxID=339359 RepID=A0AAD5WNZ2_9PEZI|nr:hypothetical protein MKZ38_005454 [Zalerion maritima]